MMSIRQILALMLIYCFMGQSISYAQSSINIDGYGVPVDPVNAALRVGTLGCSLYQTICGDATLGNAPCKVVNGATVCLSGTPNIPADALTTSATCWQQIAQYQCATRENTCFSLTTNPDCTQATGSPTCMLESGTVRYGCLDKQYTYNCVTKPASTSTQQVCDSSGTQNGLNWSTPGGDATSQFVQAAATQEFARQLALYSSNNGDGNPIFDIFRGVAKSCVRGVGVLGSLKNCCTGGGMAVSNSQVAAQMGINAGIAVFKSGAGYAAQAGSQWVYDTAISEGGALSFLQGFGPFTQATMGADPTFSFGMAGFGTTASSAGMFGYGSIGLGTGTEVIATSGAQAGMVVTEYPLYFNPYAFAAMVAIQLVMAWMACDQDSKELQSAKGQNLCLYVGDYVSKEINVGFAKIPIEITESYCCYNGLLAKDVARGAKPQLGLSWGSAQSPNCSGFTAEQISRLNFAALDLSDFTNQITQFAANVSPPVGVMGNTAANTVNEQCLAQKAINPNLVCN